MSTPGAASVKQSTLIAFAAAFTGLMPMATDIYLIVMPAISRDFGATLAATHTSMAAFALGFGVAHLFVGVFADRFGRRPVAIGGALAFLLATVAVVVSTSLEVLTACRFVQGLVIAVCPVLGRAIVRDVVTPDKAARVYSLVNAFAAFSPLTAPFLGAIAAAWGGWRMAMGLLFIYGFLLLAAVVLRLPETRPPAVANAPTPLAAAREVLSHPRFIYGGLITMLLYSALFTWISTSPFLMIDGLGFSTTGAAVVLGLGSLGYMGGSLISARLAGRMPPERLISIGAPLMLAGAIGGYIALSRSDPGPVVTLIMILPFYLGLGFTHANALQIVMRPFPHMAGQASAWLGLLQQVCGVAVSVLAVKAGAGFTAIGVMIGCCAALLVASLVLPRLLVGPSKTH
jgi:DHA1 family bicyclomycin/chloramphenicol resistance-like MFS transporter